VNDPSPGSQFVVFWVYILENTRQRFYVGHTLILSMPLSSKARLTHDAGQLNRVHKSRRDPEIYDYLDGSHALTNAMFRRRLAGYKELGHQVEMPQDAAPVWFEAMIGDAD